MEVPVDMKNYFEGLFMKSRYGNIHSNCLSVRRHGFCNSQLLTVCAFAMFTVDHLSKYLAMRLTLDLDSELPETYRLLNFCIYIAPTPGQLVVLSGNQTLRQVNDKFWKVNKPLEMFYSWKKSQGQDYHRYTGREIRK